MSEIVYQFEANHSAIDGITGGLQKAEEAKQEIETLFRQLGEVYTGQGQQALHQAHINVAQMMDNCITDLHNTQQQAREKQETMQAMDAANAAQF
ncbi:hypothetical protein [Mycobacteroides sp. LB1]|uniref:hypothetical protein n=1 Tax=Mycobacteroides sp. LB1 TaxID=2750814 RepID=UPI0015DFA999|nr:hypothetical protein [Mycobacteroides sp. LB1]MBA0047878.1 hypothetical protein [Mycobacteroides sp. LB1]